jgi:cytochrome oxidase Cu insertion factor (SCO1/SenC/PrrC family)
MIYRIIASAVFMVLIPMMLLAHDGSKHKGEDKLSEAKHISGVVMKYLEQGDKAPDFSLINQDGIELSMEQLKGSPVILTVIYTTCPDACPLVLYNRDKIQKTLEPAIGEGATFLGVSADPVNDTPEVLKEYITKLGLNPVKLHFLTGSTEAIRKVLNDYRIRIRVDAEKGTVLGHSVMAYAIDADGIVQKAVEFAQ